ncbi:MAG TPA: hypothetical protein VNT23_09770 [Gaiellaceae bacterium]|nr:hypothetical protein [Gaiellaceae bacterium]
MSTIEREDVVTIMVSLMTLQEKADRILWFVGDEDDDEEEEEA